MSGHNQVGPEPTVVHRHRPATFIRTILVMGALWYVYRCECGLELPERRAPVQGIPR